MCRLICGDCMELLPEIQDGSVDMVLCDMPYGSTQNTWDQKLPLDKLWEQYSRIVKEHGAICPCCGKFFNQEHATRKPRFCEDCGAMLVW